MDTKKLGSVGVTVLIIILGFWWRLSNRSDHSAEIKADTMLIVAQMEGYSQNRAMIDSMADRAHKSAFDKAYTMAGRRKGAVIDLDIYYEEFFKVMIRDAELMNRLDIKTSVMNLRDLEVEDIPDESDESDESDSDAADEEPETAVAHDPSSPFMSRSEFDAADDDSIVAALYEHISGALAASTASESDALKALNDGQRMLYVTRTLETEMSNGGFEAFFNSPAGRLTPRVVSAFTRVGAKKHATITRRAIAAYARNHPDQEVFKVDKTVKGYLKKYKKDKTLKSVDKDYFAVKENLEALWLKYVREHAGEFVED